MGRETCTAWEDRSILESNKWVTAKVIDLMQGLYNWDAACFDTSFLLKSIEKRCEALRCDTMDGYINVLMMDSSEADTLRQSLRVNYTSFFRYPLVFASLQDMILPLLFEQKIRSIPNEIRIWSAGCATGQEAWSLAILMDEFCAARNAQVPYRIVATDVSESDLAVAREGTYCSNALRNVRLSQLNDCFSRQDDAFSISSRMRGCVDFSYYDLLDQRTTSPPVSIYGDFDIVICCNVLIYYGLEAQRVILKKLRRSLVKNGYLITGDTERHIVERQGGIRPVVPPMSVFQEGV